MRTPPYNKNVPSLSKFIDRYEQEPLGFGLWLSTALFVIFVRDGIECLISTGSFAVPDGFHLVHVPVFFLTLLLFIIILLHFFSQTPIRQVSKIALIFFPIIVAPVAFDFILTHFTGVSITYRYITGDPASGILRFLDPTYRIPEVPASLRVEIGLITVLAFVYIFLKRRKTLPAAGGACCVVLTCAFFGSLPALLLAFLDGVAWLVERPGWERFPFSEGVVDEPLITLLELGLLTLGLFVWLWRDHQAQARVLIGALRPARTAGVVLLGLLGIILAWMHAPLQDCYGLIRTAAVLVALVLAWRFSAGRGWCGAPDNGTGRVCVTIRGVALALSLLFAYSLNEACALAMLLFIALRLFNAAPPFEFQRSWPPFVLLSGAQAALALAAGTLSLDPSSAAPHYPSSPLFWIVFIALALGFLVQDLKERRTLPNPAP